MALRPCLDCGVVTNATRCPSCERRRNPYRSAAWRHTAQAVRRRDRACVVCGSVQRGLHVHHLIPANEIGVLAPQAALVALCAFCHNRYEGDKRAGRDTPLVRHLDELASDARAYLGL